VLNACGGGAYFELIGVCVILSSITPISLQTHNKYTKRIHIEYVIGRVVVKTITPINQQSTTYKIANF
jgi:hypothetical protein